MSATHHPERRHCVVLNVLAGWLADCLNGVLVILCLSGRPKRYKKDSTPHTLSHSLVVTLWTLWPKTIVHSNRPICVCHCECLNTRKVRYAFVGSRFVCIQICVCFPCAPDLKHSDKYTYKPSFDCSTRPHSLAVQKRKGVTLAEA